MSGIVTGDSLVSYCVFSHDVMAAIFVSQNNETVAMFVSQTTPVGVELFSYVIAFFCANKFAQMLATSVKTQNRPIRLTQCCTQFKSPGVKIFCVLYWHYNVAFTFK